MKMARTKKAGNLQMVRECCGGGGVGSELAVHLFSQSNRLASLQFITEVHLLLGSLTGFYKRCAFKVTLLTPK